MAEHIETLSDHNYILMDISETSHSGVPAQRKTSRQLPRWSIKKLNTNLLTEATSLQGSLSIPDSITTVDAMAEWIQVQMHSLNDLAMPRVRRIIQRSVFWWTDAIAQLRRVSVACSRRYTRARHRGAPAEDIAAKYAARKQARREYKMAIRKAKAQAWDQLIEAINGDPWGKPYRIVLGRMRPAVSPLSETLDPLLLERILATLFPRTGTLSSQDANVLPCPDQDIPELTEQEMTCAIKRLRGPVKAPGPDGVTSKFWLAVLPYVGHWIRQIYDQCLRTGQFPKCWKLARLVLLQKEGRPPDEPSSYRPLCLIDEICKLFERLLVNRIHRHLTSVGPDLSKAQYGFRKGMSTLDAISRVRQTVEEITSQDGVAIAVSIDIKNAFNTIPWSAITIAMEWYSFPLLSAKDYSGIS